MELGIRRKWLGMLGLVLCGCSGSAGVLVDIGSWPSGAVSLRVTGTLNGMPAVEPLLYAPDPTQFVVYVPDGKSGLLNLELEAMDSKDCIQAQAQTQVVLDGGLRPLKEARVSLAAQSPPRCPLPQVLEVTAGAWSDASTYPSDLDLARPELLSRGHDYGRWLPCR